MNKKLLMMCYFIFGILSFCALAFALNIFKGIFPLTYDYVVTIIGFAVLGLIIHIIIDGRRGQNTDED